MKVPAILFVLIDVDTGNRRGELQLHELNVVYEVLRQLVKTQVPAIPGVDLTATFFAADPTEELGILGMVNGILHNMYEAAETLEAAQESGDKEAFDRAATGRKVMDVRTGAVRDLADIETRES